jgi:predicted ATPase
MAQRSLNASQGRLRFEALTMPDPKNAKNVPIRIVLTGGPGAGKTAVLEVVRKHFCAHVAVLPEAASIVYSGGFPRRKEAAYRRAAQRAIFHVQSELERAVVEDGRAAVALCDRGTIDGLAYWPDDPSRFFAEVKSSLEEELSHYSAVIHLRTPTASYGYNHQNPLRIESVDEALQIDARIAEVWKRHPRRFLVDPEGEFLAKVRHVLELIRREVPECYRAHLPAEVRACDPR